MQSTIRFSLFGNFEKFNTSNLETYMKLIAFFGKKGYKPSTANELQLQPNGQVKMIIMPIFIYDNGNVVEISSNRINFQKTTDAYGELTSLNEVFVAELLDLMIEFVSEIGVVSNRVALNCDIIKDEISSTMPTVSTYFNEVVMTEMNVRNAFRKNIENEESNIIAEKYVNVNGSATKYSYDINSIAENIKMRFNESNIRKMYESFVNVGMEVERGMNV